MFNRFRILFPRRESFVLMCAASILVYTAVILYLTLNIYKDSGSYYLIDLETTLVVVKTYIHVCVAILIIILIVMAYEKSIGYVSC